MAHGGEGVISVAANQVPGPMHDLVAACARGRLRRGPPHPQPAAPPHEPELRGVEPDPGEGVARPPGPVRGVLPAADGARPTEATREALRAALRELGSLLVMSLDRTDRARIERALPAEALGERGARRLFDELLSTRWSRAGQSRPTLGPDGWRVNAWVKKGILLGLPSGPPRGDGPRGAAVLRGQGHASSRGASASPTACGSCPGARRCAPGAYVAPGVVVMPPAYVNVGRLGGRGLDDRLPRARGVLRPGGAARAPLGGGHARRRAGARGGAPRDRRGRGARGRELRRLRGDDRGAARGARLGSDPHGLASPSTTSSASRSYRRTGTTPLRIPGGRGRRARARAASPAASRRATGSPSTRPSSSSTATRRRTPRRPWRRRFADLARTDGLR